MVTASKKSKGSKESERVGTGISNMDKMTLGGFKRRSINMIAGNAGSGKTIFAMQFLMDGIKHGESGLYMTFEEKKEKLYDNMKSFGIDLEKAEKDKKFIFLEYTPEQVKKVLVEGGGTVENLVRKLGVKRMVIDSISSFALLYKDELAKKEAALALFELIDRWNCTALLTSQDTSVDGNGISAALNFEVDSIVIISHKKISGVRSRAIEIMKMRGTKHPNKTFGLEITNKGLKLLSGKICRGC